MKRWSIVILLLTFLAAGVIGQKQPRCKNPPLAEEDYGSCAFLVRFYYSKLYNRCFPFFGCLNPKNDTNNFPASTTCTSSCIIEGLATPIPLPSEATIEQSTPMPPQARCFLMPVEGIDWGYACYGDKTLTRYYWSRLAQTCLPFRGCATSRTNNWPSKEICLAQCSGGIITTTRPPPPTPKSSRCTQELEKGIDFGQCGSIERFYYSSPLAKCVSFLGCINDNDGNNFSTERGCKSECIED